MTAGNPTQGGNGPPVLRLITRDGTETAANNADEPVRDSEALAGEGNEETVASSSSPSREREEMLRVIEALLFSSAHAMSTQKLAEFLPAGEDPLPLLMDLQAHYRGRGVTLVRVAGKWSFRTADDLGFLLKRETVEERRLSKAALETLAIIAYHQPVTRAEIEQIRGVSTSAGTLDILLDTSWIRPRGRRRAPGRPVTYGTTDAFLEHFGMDSVGDLPGLSDLRGAGLLSAQLPADFLVPQPSDVASLMPDELPLEDDEADGEQGDLELDDDHCEDEDDDEAEVPAAESAADAEAEESDAGEDADDFAATDADLREMPEADKSEPSSG